MVILLGAAAGLLLETGARAATIKDFGDALWWSGALVTTVGSEVYPVTAGGRALGFALMLYAVGIFSYFIASIASVLVGIDAGRGSPGTDRGDGGVRLSEEEIEALREILGRADRAQR
jgi:voltage-gated potassium channel